MSTIVIHGRAKPRRGKNYYTIVSSPNNDYDIRWQIGRGNDWTSFYNSFDDIPGSPNRGNYIYGYSPRTFSYIYHYPVKSSGKLYHLISISKNLYRKPSTWISNVDHPKNSDKVLKYVYLVPDDCYFGPQDSS